MSGAAKSRHRSRSTIRDQWAKPPTHSTDTCCAIKAASADAIAASRTRSLTRGASRRFSASAARKKPSPGRDANSGPRASVGAGRCSPGTDHVHVDERDLDAGLRSHSKGLEDRVARHEWHHLTHRGSSGTLEGRHRRRPAARGPFERRPERRGQFQRNHGGPRRGELLVDNPAEDGVVVIRRHARQVAERLDERRFGEGVALRQRHPPAPARPREPAAYPRRAASASARTGRARACRACCRAGPA